MIYTLTGLLDDILDDSLILNVNGVGYQVFIPESYKTQLPTINSNLKLFTYHHIREDQQCLFGFLNQQQKSFYTKLISVSGVGPKVGIKILSELSIEILTNSILTNNIGVLTQVSGVGKKMAERLIIELKDKLDTTTLQIKEKSALPIQMNTQFIDDLSLALKTLGYTQDEIKKAIQKTSDKLDENQSLETSIKIVLKSI